MACNKEKHQLIHKYMDEDITLLEKKELEAHLVKCDICHGHLRELRKTVAIIQSASHIEAPADFTAQVMAGLPKETQKNKWKTWVRRHPLIITAATFFLVFILSISSIWNDGDGEITVAGEGQFYVDQERGVVVVPEGETISGDLLVRNGNIEVEGEVLGSITVINGEQYLASAGHVAGEIEEINRVFDWLWYRTKAFFADVMSFMNSSDE
ncbi:anti-sigma factor family protein [Evansella clarkii]|jgi:anti-sigma factor RsiW|uniref:anti-sigma factor family protein n=1 Tax=Evansella clarkii TaxID=79879 RepID=UPI000998B03A|nr:anti-sigma factor [Evansella clarkii]